MRRHTALGIVARRGSVTSGELAEACAISAKQARRDLVVLIGLGCFVASAPERSARYDSQVVRRRIRGATASQSQYTGRTKMIHKAIAASARAMTTIAIRSG